MPLQSVVPRYMPAVLSTRRTSAPTWRACRARAVLVTTPYICAPCMRTRPTRPAVDQLVSATARCRRTWP